MPEDEGYYRSQNVELIKSLDKDIRGLVQKLASVEASLNTMDNELQRLRRVVIEGNGQESMRDKITRIDERVGVMKESMQSNRTDLDSYRKDTDKQIDSVNKKLDGIDFHKLMSNSAQPVLTTAPAPVSSSHASTSALNTPVFGLELWKVIIGAAVSLGITALPLLLSNGSDGNSDSTEKNSPQIEQVSPSPHSRQ